MVIKVNPVGLKNKAVFTSILTMLFIAAVALNSCSNENNYKQASIPDQVSYNFHIRPILSDNCFACHGPDANKREAGLRLDTEVGAYAALNDNPNGHAIVPGKSNQSEVIARIFSEDVTETMPPLESNLSLSDQEKQLIKKWIDQGAIYEKHWAFEPPVKKDIPLSSLSDWNQNPIDGFVLAKMKENGLTPNPKAEKNFLLKRLSLDLTGLPPTSEEVRSFNSGEKSWEQMIDLYLSKPAYGEKLALLWLDISRYADSFGYQNDNIRTQWPYRDWVIHAFNKNFPYDKFLKWQLAGDLFPEPNREQLLATAFNRNHKITEEEGVIHEEYRVEYVLDKTNTFSKVILGMTMECAQCHDHKYDPISQKDYYNLYAFFNNTPEKGFEGGAGSPVRAKSPLMWVDTEDTEGILNFINHPDSNKIAVSIMQDLKDSIRPTFILDRGIYDAPTGEPLNPKTPDIIKPFSKDLPKNRLGLVEWAFAEDHPLTSRVFVNLIWQEIFGVGLVPSSGDFGMQGKLPTHPELLDWLAVEFRESGWDIKQLIKLIVSSTTYQQSSAISKETLAIDPDNTYLSRFPRLRLHAELIRDMVLASSGLLVDELGGPSVKPYQPEGLWEASSSGRGELNIYRQDKGDKLYRRGIYTFIKLTLPPPSLLIFDGSNRDICQVNRNRTNTPLQALALLNDPLVLEASRVLAENLVHELKDEEAAIAEAFVRILGRLPKNEENQLLLGFYAEEVLRFENSPEIASGSLDIGESPASKKEAVRTAALMQVIVALYNLEEAITKT
ncbi:PSD1 and planctomycete cytochrome C domain-containing protein [Cyclobacterium marinum]|uniref:PSD1 and planctomycete cytochrome C domain-containing protein n=1 Tax=Cyclobacterium marinum TaxID=104 RepID=UPI0011ED065C|nr:PSD1 and planctomycete cytochrome C domain-containing protein [Cyclobacterium marinum]MBI0397137.1 PSD1 domain-containing protein [Cyclobacterium marinum]